MNTNSLYNESEQGCICWTYKTIPENYTLPLHEDNGYKYIHKLTQFVKAPNCRRNFSIDMITKSVKNSDLSSILYSKPLREFIKPQFEIGDRVRISKFNLPLRKGYKPQFTQEVFKIVAISSTKPSTYTIKDEQDEIIRGRFCQKDLVKVT